jgi:hypothetical protein
VYSDYSINGACQSPRAGEGVAAQQVDVFVAERGQPDGVGVGDRLPGRAQRPHRGVDVAGVPQHDGVDDQAERAELVFLAFPVRLAQLATLPVEDLARESVPGLLDVSAAG